MTSRVSITLGSTPGRGKSCIIVVFCPAFVRVSSHGMRSFTAQKMSARSAAMGDWFEIGCAEPMQAKVSNRFSQLHKQRCNGARQSVSSAGANPFNCVRLVDISASAINFDNILGPHGVSVGIDCAEATS